MSDAFAALQRLLPQHGLSRLAGKLAQSQTHWVRRALIRSFAHAYSVDLSEAASPRPDDYASFNDFFTRALAAGARPIASDPNAIVCPADGTVSQAGIIKAGNLLQAKGRTYTLASLLGDAHPRFHDGAFVTIYLAPRDYHRVHLPVSGKLVGATAIPGELFSVNARTEASVQSLFARNERLVCQFETAHGTVLVVLVGALIVASIETVWDGPASPYQRRVHTPYSADYQRGEEIGRFLLGSTVIVCFEPGRATLDEALRSGTAVRMGQALGTLT